MLRSSWPRIAAIVTLTMALGAGAASAQTSLASPDEEAPRALFAKGALGIEAGGAILGEAWNLNARREWLVDGSLSIWWGFHRRASLVVEFHATRVFQEPPRDAFVNGLVPLVRWRLIERPRRTLFVDVGPGISWSDTVTPPRGTRFNYLALAGAGVSHRLGKQTHAITAMRWLHLSNNGLEGRSRNPDIEALGGYVALAVVF
jgi:Lipid A 3-O-deacylase (PagL)